MGTVPNYEIETWIHWSSSPVNSEALPALRFPKSETVEPDHPLPAQVEPDLRMLFPTHRLTRSEGLAEISEVPGSKGFPQYDITPTTDTI